MSRFAHLKRKPGESSLSRDEFIEAADKEENLTQAKYKPSKKEILLSVSGRINREKNCGKPVLVYLKSDLAQLIKKHCHGNKTLVVNYLLERGLNALISDAKLVLHMEEDED